MYRNYFGLKERPFHLTPNPDFLYLSRTHEEALAHLAYAVSQGDGFVEITGEVGTGKTTLCRAFLESLGEDVEAAYIFNPRLNALQLLKAINDEFGIDSEEDNIKDLIDTLNFFLMRKKSQGKKVILLIDEAQNLSKEVLEQLRLLSNLETTTEKLLQIILVGQPELSEMLDSYDLRQLGQRITLSFHLVPLSLKETRDYIQHRIRIASRKPGIKFTRSAYKAIYKFSGGIPRLINIASDRAILTAYGENKTKVNGGIAMSAIRELSSRGSIRSAFFPENRTSFLILPLLCLIFVLIVLYFPKDLKLDILVQTIQDWRKTETSAIKKESKKTVPKQVKRLIADKTVNKKIRPPEKSEATPVSGKKLNPTETALAKITIPDDKSDDNPKEKSGNKNTPVENKPETKNDRVAQKGDNPDVNPAKNSEIEKKGKASFPPKKEGALIASEKTNSSREKQFSLEAFINRISNKPSQRTAFVEVMQQWGISDPKIPSPSTFKDPLVFFRVAAQQQGMELYRLEGNLQLLTRINLPTILELYSPDGRPPGYLALTSIDNDKVIFRNETTNVITIKARDLKFYWPGTAFIVWKNHYGIEGTIPREATKESLLSLKMLLRDIGQKSLDLSPVYDEKTKRIVEDYQKKYGVAIDGVVGPMTKIILYNELSDLKQPTILKKG